MQQVDIGSIDTLILCGGKGSRLQSIIPDKPKILANIGDSPFIDYLLTYLEREGIKRVILCTGYKHDQIEKWVYSSYDGNLEIILSKEKEPLGTAGAVKNAQELIHSDNFLIINGDTFTALNYREFVKSYFAMGAIGLLALKKSENKTEGYGNVEIDSMNRIVAFIEKSSNFEKNSSCGLINAGIYLFNKVFFDVIPPKIKVSIESDTMQLIIKEYKNSIYGFFFEGSFIDIGTPLNYHRAHNLLQKYL